MKGYLTTCECKQKPIICGDENVTVHEISVNVCPSFKGETWKGKDNTGANKMSN